MNETSANEIRAFVALELRDEDRQALRDVQERLREVEPAVKWVQPQNLHLTLFFLGNVPTAEVDEIQKRLEKVSRRHAPFTMTIQGTGAFPNLRRPKIVWAGITGDVTTLQQLADDMSREMSGLGYLPDKAFRSHITLGRSRSEKGAPGLAAPLEAMKDLPVSDGPVECIVLFKSELRPAGPVYTPLARFLLSGKEESSGERGTP